MKTLLCILLISFSINAYAQDSTKVVYAEGFSEHNIYHSIKVHFAFLINDNVSVTYTDEKIGLIAFKVIDFGNEYKGLWIIHNGYIQVKAGKYKYVVEEPILKSTIFEGSPDEILPELSLEVKNNYVKARKNLFTMLDNIKMRDLSKNW